MAWRIGVDSGGTFTDICLFDEQSGRIAVWKVFDRCAVACRLRGHRRLAPNLVGNPS